MISDKIYEVAEVKDEDFFLRVSNILKGGLEGQVVHLGTFARLLPC